MQNFTSKPSTPLSAETTAILETAESKAAALAATKAENKAASAAPAKPAPKRKPAANAKPKPNAKRKPAAKPAAAPKADKPDAQALALRINGERKTAASIFAQADKASVSIPVKPLSAYAKRYNATVTAHAIGRKPSVRQAAALACAAAAANVKIENGATFPRQFEMRKAQYAIENGALSDAIASGLCTYNSKRETITIKSASEIAGQLGKASIKI